MIVERWQHHYFILTQRLTGLFVKSIYFSNLFCIICQWWQFKMGGKNSCFLPQVCLQKLNYAVIFLNSPPPQLVQISGQNCHFNTLQNSGLLSKYASITFIWNWAVLLIWHGMTQIMSCNKHSTTKLVLTFMMNHSKSVALQMSKYLVSFT